MQEVRPSVRERLGTLATTLSSATAGLFLILMTAVTVTDVAGRYFLNMPLPGAFEMTQFLMAAIVYSGLPAVSHKDGHITIDLLDTVTPDRLVPVREFLVQTACAFFFAILAWRLFVLAEEAAEWGDVTQYLGWPLSPIIFFGSALSVVGGAIHLGKVFAALSTALGLDLNKGGFA